MKRLTFIILLFVLAAAAGQCSEIPSVLKTHGDYVVYLPEGLDEYKVYPVILGFSPGGDGLGVVNTWRSQADKYKCVIIASNLVRNGMKDAPGVLTQIRKDLKQDFYAEYPIDLERVIAVGSSGGGMAAHLFSFFYPDTINAVITNVGYINEKSMKQSDIYTRGKVCVFLAGSVDFNHDLMREDMKFLLDHDWNCKWIEFKGGHIMAPSNLRDEALEFVLSSI